MALEVFLNYATAKNLFMLCVIAIFSYFAFKSTKKPRNFPPGPRGFPFLGVVPLVGRRQEITYMNWSKKYGDVIGVKIGNSNAVVLNSYDAIQDALVKNAKVFSDRPDNVMFSEIFGDKGIAFDNYTPEYIARRKFAHATLSRLGFGKTSLEDAIADEAKHLLDELGEGDVEICAKTRAKIMQASGNAIAQATIGKRFSDYQNPEFQAILKGIEGFVQHGSLVYLFYEVIRRKITDHEKMLDVTDRKDFMDEYLTEMNRNANSGKGSFSRDILSTIVVDLFGGGMTSSEVTISVSCLLLANRPNLMKKIHNEIDHIIDSGEQPRYQIRDRMPFCQAFIMEVMRYRTVVPFAVAHFTSEDVKFRGFDIPKGTTVLPNLYAVHNDPEHWDEPEKFNPERHLDSDGRVKTSKHLMAFGCGPRQCIGLGLAKMELFIFFVTIFQRYSAVPTPTTSCKCPRVQDDGELTGLTLRLSDYTPVTLVRRKSS